MFSRGEKNFAGAVNPGAREDWPEPPELTSGLVYVIDGQGGIRPEDKNNELKLLPGFVIAKSLSWTICPTDRGNAEGQIGHGDKTGEVVGHEGSYIALESLCPGVESGQVFGSLGKDFDGFAEFVMVAPVLPGQEVPNISPGKYLEYDKRGFLDPIRGIRAVCVYDEWFPGASLIEPATHVYTTLDYHGLGPRKRFSLSRTPPVESILIAGAGLCGQIACNLLREWHPGMKITLMDIDSERLEDAQRRGLADDVLNPDAGLEEIRKQIDDGTSPRVQVVLDTLPGVPREILDTKGRPVNPRVLATGLLGTLGLYIQYGAAEEMTTSVIHQLGKGFVSSAAAYDSRVITFGLRAETMEKVVKLAMRKILNLAEFLAEDPVDFQDQEGVVGLFITPRSGIHLRTEVINSDLISPEEYRQLRQRQAA